MSPFFWRMMTLLSFLFLAFVIAVIAVTLLLVEEVRNNSIDEAKLTFVQVANWIYVGLLALAVVAVAISTPYFIKYTRRSESIVSAGLKPATGKTTTKRKTESAYMHEITPDVTDKNYII